MVYKDGAERCWYCQSPDHVTSAHDKSWPASPPNPTPTHPIRAEDILINALSVMKDRGAQYGDGVRERTMDHIMDIFNQLTGRNLDVKTGWVFMVSLKLARITHEAKPNIDSFIDAVNYLALLAEEVLNT